MKLSQERSTLHRTKHAKMGLLCSLLEIKRLLLQSVARRVAARGQLLRTNTGRWHLPALGPRREKARRTRGEYAQAPGCQSRSGREGTKRRRNWICAFVEYPKSATALNAGPAPHRAAGSLSRVDRESTDTPVRGKPSVARTRWVLSTQRLLSAVPRPPRGRTKLN